MSVEQNSSVPGPAEMLEKSQCEEGSRRDAMEKSRKQYARKRSSVQFAMRRLAKGIGI